MNQNGLIINGVRIKGVTADTSINGMIEKINSNEDAGVKASYLSSSNQFVLVTSETGKEGRLPLTALQKPFLEPGLTAENLWTAASNKQIPTR